MSKSRAVCFTLNNYTEDEYSAIRDRLEEDCRYYCIGREIAETGTPHLQGYAYISGPRAFSSWKRILGDRAHIESAKGSPEQNREYCSKGGDFVEFGEIPVSQKRKGELGGAAEQERWQAALDAAKTGRLDDIPADITIRHYRTLKEITRDFMERVADAEEVTGVWIYGDPGVGKSRYARYFWPDSYMKMANKWWDGFQDEDTVILDDVGRTHECLGYHFKIWMDRYAFIAETKGGAKMIRPKKFIVTSNYRIDQIFTDEAVCKAITRRCQVIHIPWTWVPPDPPLDENFPPAFAGDLFDGLLSQDWQIDPSLEPVIVSEPEL